MVGAFTDIKAVNLTLVASFLHFQLQLAFAAAKVSHNIIQVLGFL